MLGGIINLTPRPSKLLDISSLVLFSISPTLKVNHLKHFFLRFDDLHLCQ